MDSKLKKTGKVGIIRAMFSAIKKDNLEKFQAIITDFPDLLYLKDAKRENILFYAFKNDSRKIIDFVNACEPSFIKEKNIRNLNILHELILSRNSIDYYLELMSQWDLTPIQQLFINTDPQGNNAILMAAKSGSLDVLRKVIKNCPFFQNLQSHSNTYGQTVAHFIASYITEECPDIIKMLSPDLLKSLDNINGFSPLMLAAYHQGEVNFKSFFELYPHDQESFLGNNLIHFAAHNKKDAIVKLLIEKGLFTNNKNIAEQSPLLISLIKGSDKVVKEIFEQSKNDIIYQEDIVNAVKIAEKNPNLFLEIINNDKNEELNLENINLFLEGLFLQARQNLILEINNNEKYAKYLSGANFNNLFSKAITGKKDMSGKTDFLLNRKNILSKEETINAVLALEKIPGNQIKFILTNTNIIKKTMDSNKPLFSALCLAKGVDPKVVGIDLELNNDNDIQRTIKKILRNVKIEYKSKHFHNVESWIKLLDDKQIVWKHYGRIIAKDAEPFSFLEDNFKFLPRESKKELVYYTITALFKDHKSIPETTFHTIETHTSLLTSVFAGIIKVGKVPTNKQLLDVLPKTKSKELVDEHFINVLKKSHKKPKEAIDLFKETISMFDLSTINNMQDFCKALINNPFHHEIMESVAMAIPQADKDDFMYAYIDNYIKSPSATINMEVLEQLILSQDKPSEVILYTINKSLAEDDFDNIDFIKQINLLSEQSLLPKLDYAQKLVNDEDFELCIKLQKAADRDFEFKKIDFSLLDWKSINNQVVIMDKNNKFFDFLSLNTHQITEKQVNVLTTSLVKGMKENSIALETVQRFFTSLDTSIHKIEDELLYSLSVNVLDKYRITNSMSRILAQGSFDSIFTAISQNKDGKFFGMIKDNQNYSLIPNEARIVMNKEILEETLSIKVDSPKIKRIKI
jgi:ankyrin repeat protein